MKWICAGVILAVVLVMLGALVICCEPVGPLSR